MQKKSAAQAARKKDLLAQASPVTRETADYTGCFMMLSTMNITVYHDRCSRLTQAGLWVQLQAGTLIRMI